MTESVPRPKVALVAIGDELLNGQQLDTNSAWLSEQLWTLGWEVVTINLLGDHEDDIVERLEVLSGRVDLILTTGGLGPTLDDLTRHAVARAVGVDLVQDPAILEWLVELFERFGRTMSASNERQALFPRGAAVLSNNFGTAPGFCIQSPGGAWIASFPGPPRELYGMFENELVPFLRKAFPAVPEPRMASFHLFGVSESDFAAEVGPWMERNAQPRMGVCASGRVLKVRIEDSGPAGQKSQILFEARVAEFETRFAPAIFSDQDPSTALALGELLMREGISFATAESCTGGEIASRMVAQAGISDVFREGFVTYSNEAKRDRLSVPQELRERHGAVSAPVAEAMALGAARVSGARLAVSTSGIAGPGGGTAEKPVGLVYVGVAIDGQAESHELRLPDRGRDLIRDWATTSACELARRALVDRLRGGGPRENP